MTLLATNRTAVLLGLAAFLTAAAVQPGEVGSVDTLRRFQAAHSLWTSAPAVDPKEYPAFGVRGRNNHIYPWYGIGQSLVMLPADILATLFVKALPRVADPDELRRLLVTFMVSSLICV